MNVLLYLESNDIPYSDYNFTEMFERVHLISTRDHLAGAGVISDVVSSRLEFLVV